MRRAALTTVSQRDVREDHMRWRGSILRETAKGEHMNKYGNTRIEVDGIIFDSKREAARWKELKLMERAGEISDLQRQVPFSVIPSFRCNGHAYRESKYIADFTYRDKKGSFIVEDAKGVKTKEYMLKKKLVAWLHSIEIREV